MASSASDKFAAKLARDVIAIAKAKGVPCSTLTEVETLIAEHRDYLKKDKDTYVQLRLARKRRPANEASVSASSSLAASSSTSSSPYRYQLNFRAEVFSQKHSPRLLLEKLRQQQHELDKSARANFSAIHAYKEAKITSKKAIVRGQQLKQQQITFMTGVVKNLPTCATAVDFDPQKGLCKLWQFGDYTVSQLAALPSAPAALSRQLAFLSKHGFHKVFCTGIDLTRLSVNVYFALHESGGKNEEQVGAIFDDLKLPRPTKSELKYISGPGSFTMTFRWDCVGDDECDAMPERICFYTIPSRSPLTKELAAFMKDTLMPQFKGLKQHQKERQHHLNSKFVSVSYGLQEVKGENDPSRENSSGGRIHRYFKHESDWNGDYYELLNRCGRFSRARNADI